MKFEGLMTAIVTPMSGGAVDVTALRELVHHQIDGGVHGLIACGSTGEAATLTDGEQRSVVATVVAEAASRVPVVAGVGARSTHGALLQARSAAEAGANALLVVTPAYNKPTQEGLKAHFSTVADAVELPLCLYNVPGRTGVDLLPETVAQLAEHRQIVAIKEATGSLQRAAEIQRLTGEEFSLMSGDDFTAMALVAQGGHGCISVLSNILPGLMGTMLDAAAAGDRSTAAQLNRRLLPLCEALFVESNPIPVKTAATWLDLIPSAELRLPLTPLTESGSDVLEAAMQAVGLSPQRRAGAPSTLGPGVPPDPHLSSVPTVDLEAPGSPIIP